MNDDLKERLRFYQEMGIEAFYRREGAADTIGSGEGHPPVAETMPKSTRSAEPEGTAPSRPPRRIPQSGIAALPEAPVAAHSQSAGAPAARHSAPKVISTQEALDVIRTDIGPDCRRCKLCKLGRHTIVFGSGNPNSDVVFVGEGPGADEDEQGLPFVGRAGQLLTDMINNSAERMKAPLRRENVYICNVVKCRPPGNRTPEKDEIETCSPFLLRQLDAIRPRVIVTLGATAAHTLLGRSDPMNRLRGHWYDCRGAKLLVTFHPAYLLRDPSKKKEAWEDMQMLCRLLYNR